MNQLHVAMRRQLDRVTSIAVASQTCKRKAVGVVILGLTPAGGLVPISTAHNGPSGEKSVCSGEKGKCGCSHAEPRAIIQALKAGLGSGFLVEGTQKFRRVYLVTTFSPCSNCANIIVDSGVIHEVVYGEKTEHDLRGLEILAIGSVKAQQLT